MKWAEDTYWNNIIILLPPDAFLNNTSGLLTLHQPGLEARHATLQTAGSTRLWVRPLCYSMEC